MRKRLVQKKKAKKQLSEIFLQETRKGFEKWPEFGTKRSLKVENDVTAWLFKEIFEKLRKVNI